MSRFYAKMNASALRDELDRLEELLQEEEDPTLAIGIRNRIFYVCDALCRKVSAA